MTIRRSAAAIALAACAALAATCGREPASSEVRERAYRANNLGIAQLEQFNYPEAVAAFRQVREIDESLAIGRVNLSIALMYAQDLPAAKGEATEATRLLPSAPQPHYVLGLIARAENRTRDAIAEFERVHQMDGADVGASVNLAQVYLEQRLYPQAIALLRPAAVVEPYNVTVAYNLGLALTRGGDPDEGRRILERTQALRATGYAVTYGTGYLEQGRYAEAVASTGAEPEQVDAGVPSAAFAPAPISTSANGAAAPAPFGRQFSALDLTPAGVQQIAAGLGGCVTLADVDGDGAFDLFEASAAGQHLFHNDGRGAWTDITASSGLNGPVAGVPIGCVAGDYDNDGQPDLFVLRYGVSSLYHNDGGNRFSDATPSAQIPPYPFLPGAAALVDIDHDGDLDLVVAGLADPGATRPPEAPRTLAFPGDFAAAPLLLLRNNGNGTFTDTTAAARLQGRTRAIAIVPTDFDNRRDVDLLVVNREGPPLLMQNLRDGTFRDVADEVGLTRIVTRGEQITGVTAGDLNKDDFPDFFFTRAKDGVFALSDGRGRFAAAPMPDGARAGRAAQFIDYDADGLLDLLLWSDEGPQVFRNLGQRWSDVSATAMARASVGTPPSSARALVLADLNADSRTDLVTDNHGAVTFWRSGGDDKHRSIRIALKGRVSNRLGIGTKVQIRAGGLSARQESSAATPPVAPSDFIFGLGDRPGVDALRVLWPSGILQAEPVAAAPPSPFVLEELDRKPSSCPFLYTWNGKRFEFVTDFMGGGEMGYWEGPGQRNTPDPIEYVRIAGDQLEARDGRFEIRVTNELEETLFADRLQLVSIAHPPDIDIYPNEGMTEVAKPNRLFAVRGQRVPHAVDDGGHDVTERIARIDRRYPDAFALERFRGYAASHTLALDLAPVGDAPVLLLTAWTDYAFSSDNVAAHQAGLSLTPPRLEARDRHGRWRTIVEDVGIPVGRPQTVTVDLSGHLRPGEHEVRIVTNMRIYWDRVLVASGVPTAGLPTRVLDPTSATLRARGFSAEVRPDGQDPPGYDYDRVTMASPWKAMPGRYTREGDVRELLIKSDDMFVITKPGDEIAVAFDAAAAGPPPAGWTRTFLLIADGFSKEMDINSASPDTVEPLPFHGMTTYPYHAPDRYPDTPEHQRYQSQYNTRVVVRMLPMLDTPASR